MADAVVVDVVFVIVVVVFEVYVLVVLKVEKENMDKCNKVNQYLFSEPLMHPKVNNGIVTNRAHSKEVAKEEDVSIVEGIDLVGGQSARVVELAQAFEHIEQTIAVGDIRARSRRTATATAATAASTATTRWSTKAVQSREEYLL